jgi:hypothetical protein
MCYLFSVNLLMTSFTNAPEDNNNNKEKLEKNLPLNYFSPSVHLL